MAQGQDKAAVKAAKKEERVAKRAKRKETRGQMWQAFQMQRKQDKALIPLMLLSILGMGLLFFLIGLLFNGQWFMLILGLGVGFLIAMIIFTRRLERDMYKRVEDQPGVAGWALDNQLKNSVGMAWKVEQGIAMTRQQDIIHRVIGNPGVVFVAEGNKNRLKPTMTQLKRRVDKLAGGVPIYEVYVGDGEDEVSVGKLRNHLIRLPRNYNKNEVYAVARKIEAMDATPGQVAGMPKGPMPRQAQNMAGMNRRMRRAQERKGK
ncbi:DUF4191 domain-containing protein [Corynebacterium stationis]|uniref:DUF4191 domain-containing protein n=1 Tax=Corynebacterium stationis TaxID=1705 RepID=UPI00076F90FE|nr:DUF4191 domain-containing protein [Corynebacterium stationis]AMJ44288.1 hypothetical protein AW169_04720 [Corynebacterium stationis]AQX70743.1 hypothetical protein CA21670_03895 [Corynebacterium stationis]ASJ18432.1 hypothetical protein BA700_04715 [Corynebacterium stationis]HJG63525.1 DUF4191 domain-containing protein [Corynebacterium stationis]